MSESKKLTNHDITMLGIRSSFLQASFNYERMQACGFLWSMLPVLKKIHGDDKEALSLAMTDNLEFINTHPNLVGFLMGLMMSLEEGGADHDTIKGLKLALFGHRGRYAVLQAPGVPAHLPQRAGWFPSAG